jgi:hypothetical protein
MTPKEKAKQLVENYLKKVIELAYAETKTKELAKESALLCVDEIIKATQRETINDSGTGFEVTPMKYWADVKHEIRLL